MDNEQIKAILERELRKALRAIVFPEGSEHEVDGVLGTAFNLLIKKCTHSASKALAEEAEWTAKVSAGFDPERTCNNCNGPIESEQQHKCIKCITKYDLCVQKGRMNRLAKKITENAEVVNNATQHGGATDLVTLARWYDNIQRLSQAYLAQEEMTQEPDAVRETFLTTAVGTNVGRLAEALGISDDTGSPDPNDEEESEEESTISRMMVVQDHERAIVDAMSAQICEQMDDMILNPSNEEDVIDATYEVVEPELEHENVVDEIINDLSREINDSLVPFSAEEVTEEDYTVITQMPMGGLPSPLRQFCFQLADGWRFHPRNMTTERHGDTVYMLGNIAPTFHLPRRETLVIGIEGVLHSLNLLRHIKVELELMFNHDYVSITGNLEIEYDHRSMRSDYNSQLPIQCEIPPSTIVMQKAVVHALKEIIQIIGE